MKSLLTANGLRIAVPGRALIEALDCTLRTGEVLALLGGNGSGKSLLLRTLAGLRAPEAGTIRLGDTDIHRMPRREIARSLGFLPQDPESPPQGGVWETVLLGRFAHLRVWEDIGSADESRAHEALATVGLAELAARDLASLSGGEQRRMAIARLLLQAPAVYLLDEPTNHLDPAQQIAILTKMRELARAGATVAVSLHDPNLALRFADRIGLLYGSGEAEIVDTDALRTAHLQRLYGLGYTAGSVGSQRVMVPG